MKLKRLFAVVLLAAMTLSTLISCGLVTPMTKGTPDLSEYPADAQAAEVAISSNLGDIRVMSFNLQNSVKDETKENRYLAVSEQIKDYKPTLLGLQEDGRRKENGVYVDHWDNYLTEVLVNNGTYKRINDSVSTGEYCSIYYDESVLGTPVATGVCWLTHTGNSGANALKWEDVSEKERAALNMQTESDMRSKHEISCYIEDEGVVYTEVDAVLDTRLMTYGIFELNGQRFLYVNTHLQHRSQTGKLATNIPEFLALRERERMAEWDILCANVEKLVAQYKVGDKDMPVVITGDLNEVPGSPSYLHFDEKYDNASKLAKIRKGPDASWNSRFDADNNGALLTASAAEPKNNQATSTLDYCFISPNDFTVELFQVAANYKNITNSKDETGYVAVSDHLAIIADLSFGKEDTPMTLEKPGAEVWDDTNEKTVSYYDGKGADKSWYDPNDVKKEYTFTTANQILGLIAIREESEGAITFEGITFKLGKNIVFNKLKKGVSVLSSLDDLQTTYKWTTSTSSYHFKGTFDGQGHYISGVLFQAGGSGAKGLLGGLGGNAVIKDFSLVNTYMTTPTESGKNRMGSIAAVVGSGSNVLFHNVYSDAIIVPPSDTAPAFSYVGGFLGQIAAKNATVTFNYCTFAGEIRAKGDGVGGFVGQTSYSSANVYLSNCINAGKLEGNKYVGGLIGYIKAATLYVNNCANIGDITAGRCSGGLIGTISICPDLIIANCAVNANLDFSQIGAGGTADIPVEVPAGCQVGGLIGRTFQVDGFISGISLSGSIKGPTNITTSLDRGGNGINANYLAAGGIMGFNAFYPEDEVVASGSTKKSHMHLDSILVSMDMVNVDSYLGGTRELAINSTNSKVSYNSIIYDVEKFNASGLPIWGYRVDKDRDLVHKDEKNNQVGTLYTYSTAGLINAAGLDAKTESKGNTCGGIAKYSTWQKVNGGVLVPTVALRDLIQSATKTADLWTLSYQTKKNAEDATLTDYRFVSVMKDTGLPAIGYHVTMSYIDGAGVRQYKTETVYCPNVYTSIKGGDETYTASAYNGDYIFTLVIAGVPKASENRKDIIVTVQPFAAEQVGSDTIFTDYRAKTYVLN